MRAAGLFAVLHDGHDAGRALRRRWRPLTVLPLQHPAHIIGVGGETLCGGHDAVDVNREALGTRGARRARRNDGRPGRNSGRPVVLGESPE